MATTRHPALPRFGRGVTRPDEDGAAATVWALLIVAGAFVVLLGLVVDGGQSLDDRAEASRVAAQAARRGADELSAASVRNGGDAVAARRAQAAAAGFLTAARQHGTVRVDGDQVAVTITGRTPTRFLSVIGIGSFPIRQTRTAEGIERQGE